MTIIVTSANPTRVTVVSHTATTDTTFNTNAPNDRNYEFADDIVGTVNAGILVRGFGLRLATTSVNGDLAFTNHGDISVTQGSTDSAAVELVGNGGTLTYNGTGSITNFVDTISINNPALRMTNVGEGGASATIGDNITAHAGHAVQMSTANGDIALNQMAGATLSSADSNLPTLPTVSLQTVAGNIVANLNGRISGAGLRAGVQEGNITIVTADTISSVSDGILANIVGTGIGSIDITVNGAINAGSDGISLENSAFGTITVTVNNSVSGLTGVAVGVGETTTVINNGSITGTGGVAVLLGDLGNDIYDGRNGTVTGDILGNGGSDTLRGGAGVETMRGGENNDLLHGGLDADALFGDNGIDTADYAGDFGAVRINLAAGTGQFNAAHGDTLSGFENVIGTSFNDTLIGDGFANVLHGGLGADALTGGGDIDTADYAGDFGAVKVNLATGTGQFNAAQGDALSQIENVNGTEFNDILTGSGGVNRLEGRGGNDVLHGGLGADTLVGGNGADTADYAGNAGAVRIDLFAGTGQFNAAHGDTLSQIENVTGTSNNDVLLGDNSANILHGGLGADSLAGRGGVDTADYTGNAGAVRVDLFAGTGQWNAAQGDTLGTIENVTGTSNNDVLLGDNNANVLNGGLGSDSLTGRGGADSFLFNTALGAGNVDTISGYNVAADTIRIDDAIFTQAGALGTLAASRFRIGAAAGDADDRIIYNSANGAVLYDADGTGGGAAMQFATLSTGLALTNADFIVV